MSPGDYFHLTNFTTHFRLTVKLQVALHGVADVFQRFADGGALRMAARQSGATD